MRELCARRARVENIGLRKRRRRQRDVLRDVMLSASECDTWLTLEELARITRYPAASISAQLRHLRKPRYGGFVVRKRCRVLAATPMSRVETESAHGPIWEYRLERWRRVTRPLTTSPVTRRPSRGTPVRNGRA